MTVERDGFPEDEPTPWALGVVVAASTAVFLACVLIGLYDVVAQSGAVLGVGAVAVVCAGLTPTIWTWRRRPVLRWLSWGSMAGQISGLSVAVVLAVAGVS